MASSNNIGNSTSLLLIPYLLCFIRIILDFLKLIFLLNITAILWNRNLFLLNYTVCSCFIWIVIHRRIWCSTCLTCIFWHIHGSASSISASIYFCFCFLERLSWTVFNTFLYNIFNFQNFFLFGNMVVSPIQIN